MSDKQTLFVLFGGISSAILGWFLGAVITEAIVHDGGDDGVILFMFAGAVLFGIIGFVLSIKYARKHIKAE
jgi:hypothetical protein